MNLQWQRADLGCNPSWLHVYLTYTQKLRVQQSPGLVFVFHLVQRQRISAGHTHLQLGIDLLRSEPAVKKTCGFFWGCKPLMVVYMHQIVPNNDPVYLLFFQLVQCQRSSGCNNTHLKMGTNLPNNSKFGQNKGFSLQPPMVADTYIHTSIHTCHNSAQKCPCLLFFCLSSVAAPDELRQRPLKVGMAKLPRSLESAVKTSCFGPQCVRDNL